MDGLGAIFTFPDPPAGEGFEITTPVGKRWRLWGGSCLLTTSATAGKRNPFILYSSGPTFIWASGQDGPWTGGAGSTEATSFVPPNAAVTLVFDEQQAELRDIYLNAYLPIGGKAIWLPPAATIRLVVQNLAVDDQVSACGFLIEEKPV